MKDPDDPVTHRPLTISMLISESVYRLVVLVERLIRWSEKTTRPHRFLCRILLG